MKARYSGLGTLTFIFLLTLSTIAVSSPSSITMQSSVDRSFLTAAELPPLERNWEVTVVFVGYDPATINESNFIANLPSSQLRNYTEVTVHHNLAYQIIYANQSYEDALKSIIMANSVNGSTTGTWLNETSLRDVRDGHSPESPVFETRAGRAIDASSVEEWLAANPVSSGLEDGWTLYLLNHSEIDSNDHSLEHWFSNDLVDTDTEVPVDWFSVPSGAIIGENIRHQYVGLGGGHNFYLLDPSADQWYLRWAQVWYNDTEIDWPLYFANDLEAASETWDLSDAQGKNNLSSYLANYSVDIISNLFAPSTNDGEGGLNPPSYFFTDPQKINLEVDVFTIDGDVTSDSVEWVTSESILESTLSSAMPFQSWNVSVQFSQLADDTEWVPIFSANSVDYGSLTVVDGPSLVYDMDETFDLGLEYSTVYIKGGIFLKRAIVMQTPHGNLTGYSHGSAFAITDTLENLYSETESVQRRGVSASVLRQVFSILGLNTSSEGNHHVADFSLSVMSAMRSTTSFSRFESAALATIFLDELEWELRSDFLFKNISLSSSVPSKTFLAHDNAVQSFINADNQVLNHDYKSAYLSLLDAKDWTRRMWWSSTDTLRPEISEWGLEGNYSGGENYTVWADVFDGQSGIENVSASVMNPLNRETKYLMSYNGTVWRVTVPGFNRNGTWQIRTVAQDWAMNVAQSYHETVEYSSLGPTMIDPTVTMPVVIAASVITMVVAIAFAVLYDRRQLR